MAFLYARDRKTSAARQFEEFPSGLPQPAFAQQQYNAPSTPPRTRSSNHNNGHTYNIRNNSPGMTRSPQMIRCSTCNCLVPVLELGEHVCKPVGRSALAASDKLQQSTNLPTSKIPALNKSLQPTSYSARIGAAATALRVNVTQALSDVNDAVLPTPSKIPLPHSPAVMTPGPLASPSHQDTSSHAKHASDKSGSTSPSTQTHLTSSPSGLSDTNNNAGLGSSSSGGLGGGRLPFFEKYAKVYGTSPSSNSTSKASPTLETRPPQSGNPNSPVHPRSPISPGWSSRNHSSSNSPTYSTPTDGYRQSGLLDQYDQSDRRHYRDESGSGQSSAPSHLHSGTWNHLDTPDTSPDVSEPPSFRRQQDGNSKSHKHPYHDECRAHNEMNERHSEDEENDILDSYPSPLPSFDGRFGQLVIDDPDQGHDHRQHQHRQPPRDNGTRSISRGMRESVSTPDNLAGITGAMLAFDDSHSNHKNQNTSSSSNTRKNGKIVPSLSLNYRRRSQTLNEAPSGYAQPQANRGKLSPGFAASRSLSPTLPNFTGNSSSGDLDACMDDLLKEMSEGGVENAKPAPPSLKPPPVMHRSHSDISSSSSTRRCCESCKEGVSPSRTVKKDGKAFCRKCYAHLYLPKCRKCSEPIEGKAIGSGDGKLKGKFHRDCFSCFTCSAPFPSGDFYVFEQNPYCALHYHELNGTLCANPSCTHTGIEGPCVNLTGEENGNGGRYHPDCFVCSTLHCNILLDQYHYILSGLPYCEHHAREMEEQQDFQSQESQFQYEFEDEPALDTGAYYDVAYNSSNDVNSALTTLAVAPTPNTNSRPYDTNRRSASFESAPPQHVNGGSITALRKNAQPNYTRGAARRRSGQGFGGPAQRRPYAAPPVAGAGRRAEKRRTVIQNVGGRI